MKYAVEVAHMVSGVPVSVRRLSAKRERLGALLSVGLVLGGFAAAMLAVAWAAHLLGRSVYAPGFLGLWLGAAALAASVAYRRVSRRLGRYTLGTRLDADAFAPFEVDLVRRVRQADDRFEHIPVNREESAVGLCSGAYMGGMGSAAPTATTTSAAASASASARAATAPAASASAWTA